MLTQNVQQTSSCAASSTHNGVQKLVDNYNFPFNINITFNPPDGSSCELYLPLTRDFQLTRAVVATFDHSYDRTLHPSPFILGSTIQERQQAGKQRHLDVLVTSFKSELIIVQVDSSKKQQMETLVTEPV